MELNGNEQRKEGNMMRMREKLTSKSFFMSHVKKRRRFILFT